CWDHTAIWCSLACLLNSRSAASGDTRIAVSPVGSADGLDRKRPDEVTSSVDCMPPNRSLSDLPARQAPSDRVPSLKASPRAHERLSIVVSRFRLAAGCDRRPGMACRDGGARRGWVAAAAAEPERGGERRL